MPMAELATQLSGIAEQAGQILGFGGLGTLGIVGFTKLRTEVRLYRDENQKDHERITEKLDDLNGTGRENEKDIEGIKRVCKDRHR